MVNVSVFQDEDLRVVNRDDGNVALEILDEDKRIVGVVLVDAQTAVNLGNLFVEKGQNLLREMTVHAD